MELFTGYNHIGIYVKDREEAIRFYEEVLNFKLLFRVDNESDGIRIGMLQLGNCTIEVLQLPDNPESALPMAEATLNHVGITVVDLERAMEHVKSFGYEFEERGIYDVPNFGSETLDLKVAFFRGLNNERIELFQAIHK